MEEATALMNKLPNSIVEKIKNINFLNVFDELSVAGFGNIGERKALGELFSVAKSETKGTVNRTVRQ
ncbi:hypothetical protein MN034_28345 (plasmid) [Bacillus mycoides]|nr:hypothetical protein [Bacillus mycoides]OSX97811.1 hypothetical protein BTJ44_00416 [Bacillus mycoides]UNP84696.1 hypothetical protein MN034_28345 [Bacillus mycoides]